MSPKTSINKLKDRINPNKNENLVIIEFIILIILVYYDFLLEFPLNSSISTYLLVLFIIYIGLTIGYYIYMRYKMKDLELQNQFYIYSQIIFSSFLGIIISLSYLILDTGETIIFLTAIIPLTFLIFIVVIQSIFLFQVQKFLKWVLKDDIWKRLDELTRKDFKQAELSMRSENIPNAIINIC